MSSEKGNVRLCHILKWDSFDGYGFNLHAIKGKPGQFVGKVDEGSPAEAAGLKEGDQILEVNGVCVKNETHKEVVSRIKTLPSEAKLLVIDSASDAYFKANGITVDGSYPDIEILRTPPDPGVGQTTPDIVDGQEGEKEASQDPIISNDTSTTDSVSNNSHSNETITIDKDNTSSETDQNGHVENSLKLNMTAKELRAQLAARKKYDPKKDNSIDVRTKKDIVDKL